MNKKIIIIILVILILGGILTYFTLHSNNEELNNGNANNQYNNNYGLSELTFNGIKLGDTATEEMLKGIIMDSIFSHEYNKILFSVDKNKNIYALGFISLWDSYGNEKQTLDDVKIKCKNKSLKKLEDFKECFGEGEILKAGESTYTIKYKENDIELNLTMKNEKLINVFLKSKVY